MLRQASFPTIALSCQGDQSAVCGQPLIWLANDFVLLFKHLQLSNFIFVHLVFPEIKACESFCELPAVYYDSMASVLCNAQEPVPLVCNGLLYSLCVTADVTLRQVSCCSKIS
jgi:hypothetical protein